MHVRFIKDEKKVVVLVKSFEEMKHILRLDINLSAIIITVIGDAWSKVDGKGLLFEGFLVYIPQTYICDS